MSLLVKTIPRPRQASLAWLLLVVLTLIWGSSFILIKRGLAVYTPIQVATLRIFAAGFCTALLLLVNLKKIPFAFWKYAFVSGLLGNLIPSLCFSLAGSRLDSSVSGILNSFTPLATLMIGLLFFGMQVSARKMLGIVVGLAGCTALILFDAKGSLSFNAFATFPILASLCYGVNLNFFKKYLNQVNAFYLGLLAVSLVAIPAGLILFLTPGFLQTTFQHPGAPTAIGYVLLLGLMGTAVATILANRLNQVASPLVASSVTYLIPLVAIGWGLGDGEPFGLVHLLAMLTIISGVYLVNRGK
jgi:drug/metabolite transporter (DMT)-like permease